MEANSEQPEPFRCPLCGDVVGALYFIIISGRTRQRMCAGCALDQWIPPGYEKREAYRMACPSCGGRLKNIGVRTKRAKRARVHRYACRKCGLRSVAGDLQHQNATRRPRLGIGFLDEKRQSVGEVVLKWGHRLRW